MPKMFGSARQDENGTYTGGAPGDQTGKEVTTQEYYDHKKGWVCIRAKDKKLADGLAISMLNACANDHIGYDQNTRTSIIPQLQGFGSIKKIQNNCNVDCSSLVRACCMDNGFDPGQFNTANEVDVLLKSGRFIKIDKVSKDSVYNGDILVTKTKGHTGIMVSGNPRPNEDTVRPAAMPKCYPAYSGKSRSLVDALIEVGVKDTSLAYRAKIASANSIPNYKGTGEQNSQMLKLLKSGTLIKPN